MMGIVVWGVVQESMRWARDLAHDLGELKEAHEPDSWHHEDFISHKLLYKLQTMHEMYWHMDVYVYIY